MDWALLMALFSFHVSSAPLVLSPGPAGQFTKGRPSQVSHLPCIQDNSCHLQNNRCHAGDNRVCLLYIPQGIKLSFFPDVECLGCRIIQMLLLSELRARDRGLCPWSLSFQEMPVFDFHQSLKTDGNFQSHLGHNKNIWHRPSHLMMSGHYQICM